MLSSRNSTPQRVNAMWAFYDLVLFGWYDFRHFWYLLKHIKQRHCISQSQHCNAVVFHSVRWLCRCMVYLLCQLALAPLQRALQCYCAHPGWHCCDAWFSPAEEYTLETSLAPPNTSWSCIIQTKLMSCFMRYLSMSPSEFPCFFGSEEGPGQASRMMRMMRKQKARGQSWMSNQRLRHVVTCPLLIRLSCSSAALWFVECTELGCPWREESECDVVDDVQASTVAKDDESGGPPACK